MSYFERPLKKAKSYPYSMLGGIILFGLAIRISQYLQCRSLRIDEANLSLNLIESSLKDILNSFSNFQIAPYLFLSIQKCNTLVFGSSEYALRFLPFLSSILGLFLFAKLASKVFKEVTPIFLAVLLFSVSKYLILYCADVKQYSSDVLVAIVLYLSFLHYDRHAKLAFSQQIAFGLIGAACLWMSFFSVFILAAVGLCLLVHFYRKRPRNTFSLVVPYAFWMVAFLLMLYVLRDNSNVGLQQDLPVWQKFFMPIPFSGLSSITWFYRAFERLLDCPGGFSSSVPLIGIMLIIGSVWILKVNRCLFFAFTLPVLFSLLASCLKKYPFGGRMLISLLPFMLIAISAGSFNVARKLWHCSKILTIIFMLLIYLFPVTYGAKRIFNPLNFHDIKPLMKILSQEIQEDDVVYVYNGDIAAFQYYKDRYGLMKVNWVEGVHSTGDPYRTIFKYYNVTDKIDSLRPNSRVWFLFCNNRIGKAVFNEMKFHLYYLDTVGTLKSEYRSQDGFLYLYDLSGKGERAGIKK